MKRRRFRTVAKIIKRIQRRYRKLGIAAECQSCASARFRRSD